MQRLIYIMVLLFTVSCASTPSDKIAYTKVESSIIRGRTTQNEVIQIMGSPNLVTKNSKGEEVWTYTKKTYNPQTGAVNGGVILSGGTKPALNGSNTAAFDLILTFDQADIVRDYSVVSTEL